MGQLDVWKKSMLLMRRVHEVTRAYPADEKYGLTTETRKTARSIPVNVAEGKMRISTREYRNFISIALGSTGELQTHLLIAGRLGYLPATALESLEAEVEEIGRMLRGLERSLAT